MSTPVSFDDEQLALITHVAQSIPLGQRGEFLATVACAVAVTVTSPDRFADLVERIRRVYVASAMALMNDGDHRGDSEIATTADR